ncbi:MAG: biotin synthase BioB [Planctomycetes bacterium]|nr:biotin synthase BioB [Planctomycetota bacterium]
MDVFQLRDRVLKGGRITRDESLELFTYEGPDLVDLFAAANRIRHHFRGNRVTFCSIVNAKSGRCAEDCVFCAQSSRYSTGIQEYPLLDEAAILAEARKAAELGSGCFGVVAAWRGLSKGRVLDQVCSVLRKIREAGVLHPDASLGIIEDPEVAKALAEAGLHEYNHNLETSRRFFPNICTTHGYDDRLRTIRYLRAEGIHICSGGIFGLGETIEDRVDMLFELRNLEVETVPINFLNPIAGTPMGNIRKLSPLECLRALAVARFVLPDRDIKTAGGREVCLRDLQSMMFFAGASSTMLGNYLTTLGRTAALDLQMVDDLGLMPAEKGAFAAY